MPWKLWHLPSEMYGTFVSISVKLMLGMQIIGFSVRLSSSLLWMQMYRLGASYIDNLIPRDTDVDLRNSFLSPATPSIVRHLSGSDVGGSRYDSAYYTSLFEDGKDDAFPYGGGQNHGISVVNSVLAAETSNLDPSMGRSSHAKDVRGCKPWKWLRWSGNRLSSRTNDWEKDNTPEMEEADQVSRYWCHMCSLTVNPIMEIETIKCPICHSGFVEEMASAATPETDSLLIWDLDALILTAPSPFGHQFCSRRDIDRDTERVILINPFNQTIIVHGSHNNAPTSSLGDYFIGPDLDLLLQHLAENDPNRYQLPSEESKLDSEGSRNNSHNSNQESIRNASNGGDERNENGRWVRVPLLWPFSSLFSSSSSQPNSGNSSATSLSGSSINAPSTSSHADEN
ncbi:E3 ubiquitin-protein ligase RING1 [Sesamum angolense]|uniref:RING-type E3 ubiquitin transferase n=1 Tax=Sesamum angolense TaxID=2727404 RepID=A0AAE1XCI4_9LAMI|nr:E3 ubiquitin-protein ligase RING1 [Sesamum angolense]